MTFDTRPNLAGSHVLVTGANGFVGRGVTQKLIEYGARVSGTYRNTKPINQKLTGNWYHLEIDGNTDWSGCLHGVDYVVHCAARAHILNESPSKSADLFLSTNLEGTKRLAEACRGRVVRLVYLSSIGVHGPNSISAPFDESSPILPINPYTRSKAQAESYLLNMSAQEELDCVILRPPLVYGPAAPGNLSRLIRYVKKGIPLPLSTVSNRRNLISLDYLAKSIIAVLETEKSAMPVYVVSDKEVVSTPDIIRSIALGLSGDKGGRLWPMPLWMLKVIGILTGRRKMIEQLVCNLEVDSSAFRHEFGDVQECPTLVALSNAVHEFNAQT